MLLVGFFLILFFVEHPAKRVSCEVTAPDGTKYDLSGLSGQKLECTDSEGEYLYKIDPCAPTVDCNNQDCNYCQEGIIWNNYFCVASSTQLTGLDAGKGVKIAATGGEDGRAGTIEVTCDPNAGTIAQVQCVSPRSKTAYEFKFASKEACPGAGGGGLSGGSVFLIILLVLTIVYFAGGIGYNKFAKGESGADLVPNVEFWKEVPGLVQDGIMFSVRKIKGVVG